MFLIFFQVWWAGFLFCSLAGAGLQDWSSCTFLHVFVCTIQVKGGVGVAWLFLLWAMLEVVIEWVNGKVLRSQKVN